MLALQGMYQAISDFCLRQQEDESPVFCGLDNSKTSFGLFIAPFIQILCAYVHLSVR